MIVQIINTLNDLSHKPKIFKHCTLIPSGHTVFMQKNGRANEKSSFEKQVHLIKCYFNEISCAIQFNAQNRKENPHSQFLILPLNTFQKGFFGVLASAGSYVKHAVAILYIGPKSAMK